MDPIAQFKATQRQLWSGFAALESYTGMAAPHLMRFAGVQRGAKVLDVGCGTGDAIFGEEGEEGGTMILL